MSKKAIRKGPGPLTPNKLQRTMSIPAFPKDTSLPSPPHSAELDKAAREVTVTVKYLEHELDKYVPEPMRPSAEPALKYDHTKDAWDESAPSYVQTLDTPVERLDMDELYADCKEARQEFLDTVKTVKTTRGVLAGNVKNIDIDSDVHNWASVLATMETERAEYEDGCVRGHLGRIRKAFRMFSKLAVSGKSFLAFLPDQSLYTCIICGGIKFILTAAEQFGKLREELVVAIEAIPETAESVRELLTVFWTQKKVHKAAAALYVAILKLFTHIVLWWNRNVFKKAVLAVAKQETYSEDMRLKKLELLEASKKFKNEVKLCQVKRGLVDHLRLGQMHDDVRKLPTEIRDVIHEEGRRNAFELKKFFANRLQSLLQDHWTRDRAPAEPPEPAYVETPESDFTASAMLQDLNINQMTVRDKPERLQAMLNLYNQDDQDRAALLIQENKLASWITLEKSAVLLVNGNTIALAESPISYVSASLVEALENIGEHCSNAITLFFFCGDHLGSHDEYANALGMMKILLAQLLLWCANTCFDLGFIYELWQRTTSLEGLEVCEIFVALVKSLPYNTRLSIVVDGISFFENQPRKRDTDAVVQELISLIRLDDRNMPIIKILLTSPSSSSGVWRYLSRSEQLDLPHKVPRSPGWRNPVFDNPFGREKMTGSAASSSSSSRISVKM